VSEQTKSSSAKSGILRGAGVVAANTLLSRILGLVRESVIAAVFGAGGLTDIFFTAFRLPNMLRNLLGEGSLTKSFLPQFTRARAESQEEAETVASIVYTFLLLILAVITIVFTVFAKYVIMVFAPGFMADPEWFNLAVILTQVMFPYCFFIILVAFTQGILNSYKHFFSPAFSPVILNTIIIIAALALTPLMPEGFEIFSLAIGVLVAGVLQLAFQIPFLRRYGTFFRLNFNFRHPRVIQIALLFFPTLFGSSIYYLNLLISNSLASLIGVGAISYLFWAQRFFEFPLSITASPLNTAVFPYVAEYAAEGNMKKMGDTIGFGLRLVVLVSVPATAGLIFTARPIINLALQRGNFTAEAAAATAAALVAFSFGLFFYSFRNVLINVFFSLEDSKRPVYASGIHLIVFVAACLLLMNLTDLKHVSLALASSIGVSVDAILLLWWLRRRVDKSVKVAAGVPQTLIKTIIASVLMSVPGYFMINYTRLDWSAPADLANIGDVGLKVALLSGTVVVCTVVFWLAARTMRIPDIAVLENIAARIFTKLKTKILGARSPLPPGEG
jgi:putative peptidoglycan lipid II flippase